MKKTYNKPNPIKKINPEAIQKLLEAAKLFLSPEALAKLWKYHELLRKSNQQINLTRIHNFENMVRKHYIDSLFVAKLLQQQNIPLPKPLLDIGSGAGLPGIPLAIHLPHIPFILAESRNARAVFLQNVVKRLSLPNVTIHTERISQTNCPKIGSSITRAVEAIPKTLLRLEASIARQGLAIFMKGPKCDNEIESVSQQALPYKLILDYHYCLPHSEDQRRLVVLQYCPKVFSLQPLHPPSHVSSTVPVSSSKTVRVEAADPLLTMMTQSSLCIQSRANPRFKFLYSLRHNRHIKKHKQTLVCGKKLVLEFLHSFPALCQSLICPKGADTTENLKHINAFARAQEQFKMEKTKLSLIFFSKELFAELDFMGTHSPLLLIKTPNLMTWNESEKSCTNLRAAPYSKPEKTTTKIKKGRCALPITLLLPLSNPENIGAALRSCAAFPPRAIVLLKEASHPYHPKAIRASAGYCFHLPLYQGPFIHELATLYTTAQGAPPQGTWLEQNSLFALDPSGSPLSEANLPTPMTLLVGMEGLGVPENLQAQRLSLPLTVKINSLNASVALGIALYILSQKF